MGGAITALPPVNIAPVTLMVMERLELEWAPVY